MAFISSNDSDGGNDMDYYEEPSFSLFEMGILVPVTVICILLFLLGVAGNLTIILIFKRYKAMHTTVNMYFSSMALSDSLILLGLPSDLYRIWRYKPYILGDFLCKFLVYLSESCTYCTILHVTTLSIERYFAICFPLKAKATITKSRVKAIILLLWLCSSATAVPVLFLFGVEHRNGSRPEDTTECKYIEQAARSGLLKTMTWLSTLYFFLPVFCLVVLYGLICRKLWRTAGKLGGQPAARREKHHQQTIKMLAVVVLAFVVCWLPLHVGRILFAQGSRVLYAISQYFNLVSMLLFYLGASVNPILYNIMSQKYRKALCRFLSHRQVWQFRRRSEETDVEISSLMEPVGSFSKRLEEAPSRRDRRPDIAEPPLGKGKEERTTGRTPPAAATKCWKRNPFKGSGRLVGSKETPFACSVLPPHRKAEGGITATQMDATHDL